MNRITFAALCGLFFLAASASAQDAATPPPSAPTQRPAGAGGLAPGVTREQMWYAPSAEDWKKPCLIQWQRSWDDAVAVSKGTGKAILVCVNMDGEIASEHYAGVRYRMPEIAKLYEPYVCVIASVYRHNARDYDDEGRRIVCPRFGTVTCSEHIWIEPGLFDKYFDGARVAPRHIGVELDKSEMYDMYYAFDTDSIFNALKEGIANRPPPPPIVKDDRPVIERVDSPDVADRIAVEETFKTADASTRRSILARATKLGGKAPVEVLRLSIFSLDVELGRLARQALAQSTSPDAVDLIAEALRVPMESQERDALVAALERLGATSPRAHTLAAVHKGLASRSDTVDFEGWSKALDSAKKSAETVERTTLEARLEGRGQTYDASPNDAAARLDFAEASLALAVDPKTTRKYARVLFEDAQTAAREAEKQGLNGRRAGTVLAICAQNLGDLVEARKRAEEVVNGMPADAREWSAAAVLAIFADARQQAIAKAMREKADWPPSWLTDVHAAFAVLAKHPFGTDANIVSHYDFLRTLGGDAQAARVLDDGIARFPDSWILHDRLRARILAEKGAEGLEPVYAALLRGSNAAANMESFAGYAALVAAEFHRRGKDDEKALAAYERGIAYYEGVIAKKPDERATSDHFIALALAGQARIAFEKKDDDKALALLIAAFERRPDAAASLDGLNLSPVDTAKALRARLSEEKREEPLAKLQAELDKLDPAMLRLPAYEQEVPGSRRGIRPPRPRDGVTPR